MLRTPEQENIVTQAKLAMGQAKAIRENVAAKNAVPSAVYNLNGQRVNSQFSTPNSQLKKGLYIINGRKVVLK